MISGGSSSVARICQDGPVTGLEELIGRADDAAAIPGLLVDHPVVTLHGPGGLGKTTLATVMAGELESEFPGGVHVVELAAASPTDDVAYFVARQLGVDTIESIMLRAAGNLTLIVLDNCETVLDGASAVAEALTSSPDIRVLATSRSPLRVAGERVYALDPLGLPGIGPPGDVLDSPAAELFVRRSREAGARWEPDSSHLAAIARVVSRLDGLPLAIELAASRSRMLTPSELVEHLDQRLDLLARPGSDDDDRHGSLRAAIATSYDPLPTDLQALFRRLAPLPGSFDLTLAHRVASDAPTEMATLDRLSALLDSSLLDARPGDDGRTTYRLLDSIRAFALEQLDAEGEREAAHEAFVDAMADFADEMLVEGTTNFSTDLLARIRQRFPHMLAAIKWCLGNDATGARAYRLFLPFYGPTGARSELAEVARRMADRWQTNAPLQAEAFAVMGTVNFIAADYENGDRFARSALDHPDVTALGKLIAHRTRGMIAATDQRLDDARAHVEAGIELASVAPSFRRELQIAWGAVVLDDDDRPGVIAELETLVAEARATEEAITVVWGAVTLAYHHVRGGDLAAAESAAADALEAAAASGVPWAESTAHRVAGATAAIAHGWEHAAVHFRTAVETTVAGGDMEGMAMALRAAAGAATHVGDHDRAARLWATIPRTQGIPVLRSVFHEHEERLQTELGRPAGTDLAQLAAAARGLLGSGPEPAGPLPADGVLYRFEDTEVDLSRHEVRRDGSVVHVEPQVFDVLVYLLERAGELVTKNDILDNVWGDRFVSEAALSSRIAFARKALGDDGKQQRVIRTVHGRGFRFVAELR